MVTDCDQLTDLQIIANYPETIKIGNLSQIKAFSLDLSCEKCILELDRFDIRVFNFPTAAGQLESFLLRPGKCTMNMRANYDKHSRYQAVKWEVNKATKFDVTV